MAIFAEVAMPLRSTAARSPQAGHEQNLRAREISSPDLSKGRRLFMRDCAHCHGSSGDGNSPVRQTLHPAPLDLTSFDLTDTFILNVLHEGLAGTDMPAWHVSPEEDLRAVSAYTARLGRPDQLAETDRFAPPEALLEAGRRASAARSTPVRHAADKGRRKGQTSEHPQPPCSYRTQPSP